MLIGNSRYASGVRSRAPGGRWTLAFFLVIAILFAPAREEHPAGPVSLGDELVGARILAPTVREAIAATDPKLSARQFAGLDQRSRPEVTPMIPASVVAVLLLVLLTWLARRETGAVLRWFVLQARVPRAPPNLLAG
jgi:hypothetical protein